MKKPVILLLATLAVIGSALSQTAADNTAKNARDRSDQTLTAGDQSNSPADLKMTAAIRRLVVADKSLSLLAKNAKIITIDEVVTLRGPVKSEAEKNTIQAHAQHAGAQKIVNQLEVKNS